LAFISSQLLISGLVGSCFGLSISINWL
jgi:hypothetical protein